MCQHQNQCNALLGSPDSFQEARHLGIHEISKYYCKTSMPPPTLGKKGTPWLPFRTMWLTTLQNLLQNHSTTSTIAKSSRPWPILTGKKAKTTRYSRPPKWSAASVPVPDTPRGPMSITQWIEAFHVASGTLAHVLLIKIHIKTTKKPKQKWGFSTVCIDFILHTTTCFRCGVFDWVKTLRVPLFQPGNKVYMLRYTGSVIVHTFTLLYCHKKKSVQKCVFWA